MYRILLASMLLLAAAQASDNPKVSRIFVVTPYNASIIFEYANAAFPEDEPLRDGAIDCLVAELKATGLFTDISVILKPTEDGREVNIDIKPVWNPRREKFVIEEIVFEGFTGIDGQDLPGRLRQKGLIEGTPLMSYPISKIKVLVDDTVQEMSLAADMEEDAADKILSDLSFRIISVAPEKVRLVVVSGHKGLCQQ
jgi:hypothetical protein